MAMNGDVTRVLAATLFLIWLAAPCAFAGDALKLLAEIKQDDNIKLDWVSYMGLYGESLFVVTHRDGDINCFKRDTNTGQIAFLKAIDLNEQLKDPKRHLDAFPVLTDKNILYASGFWTHASSDQDSIGLSWYQYEPKDASAKHLGTIKCPAGTLALAPNGKMLYLGLCFSNAIQMIALDPNDGKPTLGERVSGSGLGARFEISPDKKHLYSVRGWAAGWANIQPTFCS